MMLSDLLDGVTVRKMFHMVYGHMIVTEDLNVHAVQYDSRKVERGDVFVAIRGNTADGHRFIDDAVNRGAAVIVMEDDAALPDSYFLHTGVVKIVVPDSRVALARMSYRYFGMPSRSLLLIGVTGTNGKTTTTHLVKSILEFTGKKTGLIGTISFDAGDGVVPATHTTPESLELNSLLSRMVTSGCSAAVMEVSSHALHQHRVDELNFSVAVFTNLTQDHLDYHHTMEEYFEAKKILFERLDPAGTAVINLDDPWAAEMRRATKAKVITYGTSPDADVRAADFALSMNGTMLTIAYGGEETRVSSRLIGRFNVSNMLAAFGVGLALGIPRDVLRDAVGATPVVPGRFEQFQSPAGWTAVIDYAHTPDALDKALRAIHDVSGEKRGRIITVFGCGGNRDRAKRPLMAAIATSLSDLTIVTSDNPRHEDPEMIIDEVMGGTAPGARVERIPDRREAILWALEIAAPGDILLIAGKGHEEYQVIGDKKFPFSDRAIVQDFISRRMT